MSEERGSYGDYSVDDEDQPGAEDGLTGDPARDPEDELDPGYSPPEKWSVAEGYGNTPWEEAQGESLDQRLRQEVPDEDPLTDWSENAEYDEEVGDVRAGRLVDPDEGEGEDTEKDLIGEDVGIDGGAASAEEAAIHIIPDDWDRD